MSLFPQADKANSYQTTVLYGYPVQTSIFGKPLALVYGTNKIAPNIIGVFNFRALPVKSGGKGGSKGSGGGKFGTGTDNQQYTYRAAIQMALCQGPIVGVNAIWQDKTKYAIQTSVEKYTVSGGSPTYTVSQHSNILQDLGVTRTDPYSTITADYGAPGFSTLTGNTQTKMTFTGGTPGPGQYGFAAPGVYKFSSFDAGKVMTITYTWKYVTSSTSGNPTADLNLSIFNGTRGQLPWTYLSTNYPDQALGYSLVACAANDDMDLGQSGVISNHNFEVMGLNIYGGGIIDANPKDILVDYLTDPDHGVPGWSAGDLGNLNAFSDYCVANGIFVSPVFDTATSASTHLTDLMTVANCAAVFSDGVLKVVPYGDKTTIGNGVIFTPNTHPVYDLSFNDFLVSGDEDPIQFDRPSLWDAFNSVKVEWCNRGNDYTREPVYESSLYHIQLYGLREDSQSSYPMITTAKVAQFVANTKLQRKLYIRNIYKFKLPLIYDLLEPMDMVTLTNPNQGLNKTPVRITSISENDNNELEIEAEEFPWGTATSTTYPKQVTSSFTPGYYADPGNVHAPMFFEPVPKIVQDSKYHLWIALSGGQDWGGCNVWMGVDGTNYDLIGTQKGPSTMGKLTANLAVGASVDTVNTLSVSMLDSFGALASYSTAQASQGLYLLQVDDELIAYETATLTGPYTYDITTMYRGMFGTRIASHSTGAKITFIDNSLFEFIFGTADIGNVRHFKFASFNKFGQAVQDLSVCTDYTYTPTGLSDTVTISNVSDYYLTAVSQSIKVVATTMDVNVWLPEEDLSSGDAIYIYADAGNTHNVNIKPLDVAHGGDAADTIDGSTAGVTLTAGNMWEGVAV